MFRVAVILNESELLRSGYANVTPKLQKLTRLSHYDFESFTVVNINSLFQEGSFSLHQFDSLIITTNATSDVAVLDVLRLNRPKIEAFLEAGKGIFIASQKKLSKEAATQTGKSTTTEFLPDFYEFCTRERPKVEWDSGVGRISVSQGSEDHALLGYPEAVSTEIIATRCEKNEFRRHYYRSHMEPVYNAAYQPILVDTSYRDATCRVLLMVGRAPRKQERVIVSTIALDWEFHEALLSNILVYVTEGTPTVAFIRKPDHRDGDYDFLLTNAKLSKIPHVVYSSIQSIPRNLKDVHNTYIFSPGWAEADILAFMNVLHPENVHEQIRKNPYRRIYFFQKFDKFLTLTQHSTFSTIDLIVDRSSVWLSSQFPGCMWGRSFWITHDVLQTMLANGVDVGPFVAAVLKDIAGHYRDGSYDGVMGATCGLLDLIVQLQRTHPTVCEEQGFGQSAVMEICQWVTRHFEAQSADDRWAAFLTLSRLGADFKHTDYTMEEGRQMILRSMLQDIEGYLSRVDLRSEHVTEIDLCKFLAIGLMRQSSGSWMIAELLRSLRERQGPSGEWRNIGRTAHVVVFLLKHWEALITSSTNVAQVSDCEDMIYNGILFLRSQYNWADGNWRGDLQATANASHAMGLYNRRYRHSTQEFIEALEVDSENILSANLIRTLGAEWVALRGQTNAALARIEELTEANRQNHRLLKYEPFWRYLSLCSGALLVGLTVYLFVEHRQVVIDAVKAVGALSVTVALVVGLAAGWFISKMAERKRMLADKK